jgi:hypothetical protein
VATRAKALFKEDAFTAVDGNAVVLIPYLCAGDVNSVCVVDVECVGVFS